MSEQSIECPRRVEAPFQLTGIGPDGKDTLGKDDTCSYCGSLNPATFMARLEIGDIELGPTDKNYKVYVKNHGGATFKQTYRDCPTIDTCKGPGTCTHWVTREVEETKFYFQHLSVDQKKRFVELLNEKKLKIGMPGHFYTSPFFISRG